MTDYNKKPYDEFPQDIDEIFVDDNINRYGHSERTLDELDTVIDEADVTSRTEIEGNGIKYDQRSHGFEWSRKELESYIEELSRDVSAGNFTSIRKSKERLVNKLWYIYDQGKSVKRQLEEKAENEANNLRYREARLERVTNVVKHAIAEVRKRDKSVFKMFLKR